jgi:hypothetical protein
MSARGGRFAAGWVHGRLAVAGRSECNPRHASVGEERIDIHAIRILAMEPASDSVAERF